MHIQLVHAVDTISPLKVMNFALFCACWCQLSQMSFPRCDGVLVREQGHGVLHTATGRSRIHAMPVINEVVYKF